MNLNTLCNFINCNTNTLQIISIVIILIGTYLIYKYSPQNSSVIDGGNASTDYTKIEKKDKIRNNLMGLGIGLIILGTLVQTITLLC